VKTLVTYALDYWWLLLIFGSVIAGAIEGLRDFVLDVLSIRHTGRPVPRQIEYGDDDDDDDEDDEPVRAVRPVRPIPPIPPVPPIPPIPPIPPRPPASHSGTSIEISFGTGPPIPPIPPRPPASHSGTSIEISFGTGPPIPPIPPRPPASHSGTSIEISFGTGPRPRPAPPAAAKKPGPCVHRNVTPIITRDDELVGWLCKKQGCEKRLPPDWAVLDEDL
jgi:hypothetical protein